MTAPDEERPEEPRCKACGDTGEVEYDETEYVTRDMAIDAGDRGMEGMPMHFKVRRACPECCS